MSAIWPRARKYAGSICPAPYRRRPERSATTPASEAPRRSLSSWGDVTRRGASTFWTRTFSLSVPKVFLHDVERTWGLPRLFRTSQRVVVLLGAAGSSVDIDLGLPPCVQQLIGREVPFVQHPPMLAIRC